jgi:hypothetical protein
VICFLNDEEVCEVGLLQERSESCQWEERGRDGDGGWQKPLDSLGCCAGGLGGGEGLGLENIPARGYAWNMAEIFESCRTKTV